MQLDRLARDHLKRPLLQTPDREQRLNEMALHRNPLYAECADSAIVSNGRHPGPNAIAHIVEEISSQWQRLPKATGLHA